MHPQPASAYLLGEDRVEALARRVAQRGGPGPGVTRAVIFLTQKCNMRCAYCRSVDHDMPPWDEAFLGAHLEALAISGTRHIQWTGGEVSILKAFPRYVEKAAALGMNSSISTNGTGSLAFYLGLARAGVRHFYISLDVLDTAYFDEVTSSRARMGHVKEVIEGLGQVRGEARTYKLVVNSVLTPSISAWFLEGDGARLSAWLRWAQCCGADDFKFLPAPGQGDAFGSATQRERFVACCRAEVPASYAFFHYRLEALTRGGHGLAGLGPFACWHGADDRAFDSVGAYPCVIQLREGGPRLYTHGQGRAEQGAALAAFLASDRTQNEICKKFCFDVYRDFSLRVAERLARS